MSNGVIIGTFVKRSKIFSFLEFLKHKTKINIEKVFIFTVENNNDEYLITFSSPRINPYFNKLHDATILHVKNGCLFSINALNKYIELQNSVNVPNKDYSVNWNVLKNTLLITTNGNLKILKLTKIKDIYKLIKTL